MSQLTIALVLFGTFVVASFAWYGYRQAHAFWRWDAFRWAKVLGVCGVSSLLLAVVSTSISGYWKDTAPARQAERVEYAKRKAECDRELNKRFQALLAKAKKAEQETCAPFLSYPYPNWHRGWTFYCGTKQTGGWRHDIAAPPCNTVAVKDFSCGTMENLNRLLPHCGLYEEK